MKSARSRECMFCFVVLLSRICIVVTNSRSKALSDLIEDLFSPSTYNSRARPGADTDRPLDVYINININDISSISEMKMEFSTTLYLRQVWRDERLAFGHWSQANGENRNVTLHHKQFDRMWTPDVFIRNLKAGLFHTITVPNRLIRLSPDGWILYSQRLTLTLACDMVLNKYPMDNQTCKIEFGSYAYTTDDLVFHWRTDATPVEVNKGISLPEYDLSGVSQMVCSQNINSTGSFPCLRAHIHLERRLRAYVLSTFLPSMLVVLLSWVSFWIDLESVPARISLGILTMLTITTQSSGHLRGMPAVSFTKAIDVWMATCLVFVFGSFIEYSVVNVLARREKTRLQRQQQQQQQQAASQHDVQHEPPSPSSKCASSPSSASHQKPGTASYVAYGMFKRKEMESGELQEMIPLTSVPSTEENTPVHRPFNNHVTNRQSCRAQTVSVPVRRYATTVRLEHSSVPDDDDGQKDMDDWRVRLMTTLTCGAGGKRQYGCCNNEHETTTTALFATEKASNKPSQALMVDVVSRVLFPVMFAIFNMIYWPIYLM